MKTFCTRSPSLLTYCGERSWQEIHFQHASKCDPNRKSPLDKSDDETELYLAMWDVNTESMTCHIYLKDTDAADLCSRKRQVIVSPVFGQTATNCPRMPMVA